ncbi:conserved hypothetical protein [Leptospira interrogans serovar Manilae]|uniref:Uncharacterized protein n=1 Tax=Leptospira interrogans serovar Manilae TaxID=214675 RepID=A0AAQ1NXI5_LEPIR|nr:conserved hypothetical protein [Leptospira interrogans serovar Manilae]
MRPEIRKIKWVHPPLDAKTIEAKEPAKRPFKLSVSFLELNKTPPEC